MNTAKLSVADRKQIIIDHLQGIPNKYYEVKESKNGVYRVYKREVVNEEEETQESQEASVSTAERSSRSEPVVAPSPPTKQKRVSNEDIISHLNNLVSNQNNSPQTQQITEVIEQRPSASQKGFNYVEPQPQRRRKLIL